MEALRRKCRDLREKCKALEEDQSVNSAWFSSQLLVASKRAEEKEVALIGQVKKLDAEKDEREHHHWQQRQALASIRERYSGLRRQSKQLKMERAKQAKELDATTKAMDSEASEAEGVATKLEEQVANLRKQRVEGAQKIHLDRCRTQTVELETSAAQLDIEFSKICQRVHAHKAACSQDAERPPMRGRWVAAACVAVVASAMWCSLQSSRI